MTGPRVSAADRMYLEDPIPTGWRTCEICEAEGYEVRPTIGRYLIAGKVEFATVTRCKAHAECRRRCEAAGNVWPLVIR